MPEKWDSEVELGSAVISFLREQGWKVYPELCDIDIIATKDDPTAPCGLKIIGVECKKHFNLTVLSQAHHRREYVDESWIAVSRGWNNCENFGCMIASQLGIGVLFAGKSVLGNLCEYSVNRRVAAAVHQRRVFYIDKMLHPEAESYSEAGKKGGRQWSMFKKTVMNLVEYVKSHPGCEISEAIKNIEHHYANASSARSSILKRIKQRVIKEIVASDGKLNLSTETSSSQ